MRESAETGAIIVLGEPLLPNLCLNGLSLVPPWDLSPSLAGCRVEVSE